jgi:hypothetical protein
LYNLNNVEAAGNDHKELTMKILRKILGVTVMIAGLVGLVLSLSGLVGMWVFRPTVVAAISSTIDTLNTSADTSLRAMAITGEALSATVDSVDALSEMLATTADTVSDTKPAMAQMNTLMKDQLPNTLNATMDSLNTSKDAARSLEGAIQSLDTFRTVVSAVPLVGAFVSAPQQSYNPEKPLADSLGEVSASLEGMPESFIAMADSMDKADDNLDTIQANLLTMSTSVGLISDSLSQYQAMIGQSQSSIQSLKTMLTQVQTNLDTILNYASIVLGLLMFWMLATQVVIFSQGWELYQGTAGRMEGGAGEPGETKAADEAKPASAS